MCGVAYLYSKKGYKEESAKRMSQALGLLKHRGPDEKGQINGDNYSIGHTRLSIIDLAQSKQPMMCPNGRYEISFNGEIYNYKELRESLELRWRFSSEGDTEVVLAGLAVEGVSFFSKMAGMWAVIFRDTHSGEVIFSRDRFGKKPLYFVKNDDQFACASEIPALKVLLPESEYKESEESVIELFRFGFYSPGNTIYSIVNEVKPGHYLEFDPESLTIKSSQFWNIKSNQFHGSKKEAQEEFKRLFIRAVGRRLVADVEVGALLSGGIDSSIIASVVKNEFAQDIKTFTVGFGNSSYDESNDAVYVAEHFGLENKKVIIESFDHSDLVSLLDNNIGQPFGDASILPTALVSKLASKDVKVCLSGDGADEALSGYQRYQARLMYQWYSNIPCPIRTVVEKVVNSVPASQKHHSRSLLKKAQLFVDLMDRYEQGDDFLIPRILPLQDELLNFPSFANEINAFERSSIDATEDDVAKMMHSDLYNYLPQDILLKADRASMAHSLELRSPFLDHELVEFCLSLPRSWHRRGFVGKRMLRESMNDYLPKRVWQKRKQGFAMPLGDWFLGGLGQTMFDMVHDLDLDTSIKNGILQTLEQHRNRTKDLSLSLWSMFTYLNWRQSEGVN